MLRRFLAALTVLAALVLVGGPTTPARISDMPVLGVLDLSPGHSEAIEQLAPYLVDVIDPLTPKLRELGFDPEKHCALPGVWETLAVEEKLKAAALAAERADRGGAEKMLALLSAKLAREFEPIRAGQEPLLRRYVVTAEGIPVWRVAFERPQPNAFPDLPPRTLEAINVIADYVNGNTLGRPTDVLVKYFELDANKAHEIIHESSSLKEALERGLAENRVEAQEGILRRLMADLADATPLIRENSTLRRYLPAHLVPPASGIEPDARAFEKSVDDFLAASVERDPIEEAERMKRRWSDLAEQVEKGHWRKASQTAERIRNEVKEAAPNERLALEGYERIINRARLQGALVAQADGASGHAMHLLANTNVGKLPKALASLTGEAGWLHAWARLTFLEKGLLTRGPAQPGGAVPGPEQIAGVVAALEKLPKGRALPVSSDRLRAELSVEAFIVGRVEVAERLLPRSVPADSGRQLQEEVKILLRGEGETSSSAARRQLAGGVKPAGVQGLLPREVAANYAVRPAEHPRPGILTSPAMVRVAQELCRECRQTLSKQRGTLEADEAATRKSLKEELPKAQEDKRVMLESRLNDIERTFRKLTTEERRFANQHLATSTADEIVREVKAKNRVAEQLEKDRRAAIERQEKALRAQQIWFERAQQIRFEIDRKRLQEAMKHFEQLKIEKFRNRRVPRRG